MPDTNLQNQLQDEGGVALSPLVRCFATPAPQDGCVYKWGDEIAWACDEEGKTLSSHYCSAGWAQRDIMRSSHHADYARRYPDGYRTEWVGTPPENWEGHSSANKEL